jgi:hypothetical protein
MGVFHSFLRDPIEQRNYYAGFYLVNKERWTLDYVSPAPIWDARRDAKLDLRGDSSWHPNAIFPCGLIPHKGGLAMSYGWQDCRCLIDVFPVRNLMSPQWFAPVQENYEKVECVRDIGLIPPGGYNVVTERGTIRGRSYRRFIQSAQRIGLQERDVLGLLCAKLPASYKSTKWEKMR